ncbi:MAG: AAA family ATPase, partial [Bacteroidota bacterium]
KMNFFNSHVRLSMDLLNTRNKENIYLNTCLQTHSKFVVDNTNPTREDREKYIQLAKENKYEVVGYYFSSSIQEALERNELRSGKEKIPEIGIRGCFSKLEIPSLDEGFDELYFVRTTKNHEFEVEKWKDEI